MDGVPERPEAWLLAAARRRLADAARHAAVRAEHAEVLRLLAAEAAGDRETAAEDGFPDQRLALLFVCAHPAIDASLHAPLMLQVVLGLDAARIASAFLVAPATMGQRLVRAKTKIREAGIPFEVPAGDELARRLDSVLEAIYAAFGLGWDDAAGADPARHELAGEAVMLARALRERLPGEPEARGLLALLLHLDARRAARRGADGRYVPLSEQDPSSWDRERIDEAERELAAAAALGRIGRFQLEAAIQSVHAGRTSGRAVDWAAIAAFYAELERLAPTLGAAVGRAAALAEARGPADALALLDSLEPATVDGYQPFWAVRAHVLDALGRGEEARAALDRAIGLASDPAARAWLRARRR